MLSLHRWTRYAKDRLYVTEADGRIVGWLDLMTGAVEIETVSASDEIRALIDRWFRDHGDTVSPLSALRGAITPDELRPRQELTLKPELVTS
jgi:hypothetical protein